MTLWLYHPTQGALVLAERFLEMKGRPTVYHLSIPNQSQQPLGTLEQLQSKGWRLWTDEAVPEVTYLCHSCPQAAHVFHTRLYHPRLYRAMDKTQGRFFCLWCSDSQVWSGESCVLMLDGHVPAPRVLRVPDTLGGKIDFMYRLLAKMPSLDQRTRYWRKKVQQLETAVLYNK